ncbi:MAG: ABC transporter transmembrane domain-containing protein, partial [Pseudomonadota bacterium]
LTASLGANLLALAVPMAMLQIYDRVIPNQGLETLAALGLIVAAAILGEIVIRTARHALLCSGAERFEQQVYGAAIRSIIQHDPARVDRVSQGDLFTRLSGIERLRSLHTGEAATAFLDLPFALLFLSVILMISPLVGAAVVLLLGASFVFLRLARGSVLDLQRLRQSVEARRHSFLMETLESIDTVKALQAQDFMKRRYERLLAQSAERSAALANKVQVAQGFTAAVGTLAPLFIGSLGAYMVIQQSLTIGALAAIILLTGRIVQPVLRMEAFLAGADNARQAREDIDSILQLPQSASGTLPLERVESLILKGVATQAFPGSRFAFRDLNLTLETGDCIAVTGPSRAALSEFLKVLSGEACLTEGEMLINGVPVDQYRLVDRQERIRILAHDHALLQGTLLENMCLFKTRTYRDRAVILAQEIGLADMLSGTPDGYSTAVGSAGQSRLPRSAADATQVVSGLVCDPDVVLFDEANDAFDIEMDRRLLAMMEEWLPRRMTVLVSNRPSYLRLARWQLDLSDHIVEQAADGGDQKAAA